MPAQPSTSSRTFLCFIIVFTLLGLGLGNIFLSAKLSDTGSSLKQLETTAQTLKHQNQLLEQQSSTQKSLTHLHAQAEALGFTQKPALIIISSDTPVAQVIDSR